MTRRGLPWLLVACLPLAEGAGPASAQSTPRSQRADTVVKVAGRPLSPNGGTLVPELTVGVADGPEQYMFGSVNDVLEKRDGSILVLDGRAGVIRQYDARGTYIRAIGRKGQGPGEFLGAAGLDELPDGRTLLVDAGNVRVNVYGPDGASVATWRLASDHADVKPRGVLVDTTGTAVVSLVSVLFSEGRFEYVEQLLRFAPSGRIVDTVHAPAFAFEPPTVTVRSGSETASTGIPFFPRPMWAWSPLGYLVTGLPTRYAFELRIPQAAQAPGSTAAAPTREGRPTSQWKPGDQVVSIRHSVPPVPVSDEQRSVERARIEASLRHLNPAWVYTGPEVPRVKPPYTNLRMGEDGTIWVQLSVVGERYIPEPSARRSGGRGGAPSSASSPRGPEWREAVVFDVFEPDGRYLGRMAIPKNVSLFRLGRSRLWGAVRDEDDVQVVRRFRLEWR